MTLSLDDNRPPVPPTDLILRTGLSFDADEIDETRTAFDLQALEHLHLFENALHGVGRPLTDFTRMLDFGCGCGRFLRHLRPISDRVEIHGTDIDAEMIEWVRRNIPYAASSVGRMEPPLSYPDEYFDLVINHSVFSHLDEHHQDLWLAELQRITRPGGLLLLTVEGQSSWNRTAFVSERAGDDVERWRAELETRGILVITDDHFIGSTHPDTYHSTVHAPWYVFEHWNAYLEVTSYLVDGSISQDLIVLRRRPNGAGAARPIGRRFERDESTLPDRAAENGDPVSRTLDPVAVNRELSMLRDAVDEQGRRVSATAAQLREEIAKAGSVPARRSSPSADDRFRAIAARTRRGITRFRHTAAQRTGSSR
jgi:SAM-dependent methyltransferase